MRTLLLNPPSFQKFDGGAGSRWPATREIESYWYPVWLCYPAAMIDDSRVVDAPPHGLSPEAAAALARDFELLVLFTSTPGLEVDLRLAGMMKDLNPTLKIAFVGPPATVEPEKILGASTAVDFVVRREFDHQIAAFARGLPLPELPGVSFRCNGCFIHNPEAGFIEDLDALPWVTPIYKRDLDIHRYNVPFLQKPFIALYTSRGCPARCTFCLWPQTHSGHRWRRRSPADVAAEVRWAFQAFPGLKEVFFDDDTFNYQKARTLQVCAALQPLGITWSCTSRVTTDFETLKAMKAAGCRLLIVGYETGDPEILRNVKKGATIEMAERFTRDARRAGLKVHGDFIVGLPGESRQSLRRTIDFAKRLDCETIQVSIAHPYPGTEFYDWAARHRLLTFQPMTDAGGHQLPTVVYPGLDRAELLDWVERFYGEYYFRPRVIWRLVRGAWRDGAERRRLLKEGREYLALRAQRKRFVRQARQAAPAP